MVETADKSSNPLFSGVKKAYGLDGIVESAVVVVVVWMDKAAMTVKEGRIRIEDNLDAKHFAAATIAEHAL